jgi:enoyl-CoA hydratase/carnithine racemase
MSDYKAISFEKNDQIATIMLNQPERRNPLTWSTAWEIVAAFKEAEQDDDVRVIILAAAGKTFCAGGDLAEMAGFIKMTALELRDGGKAYPALYKAIRNIEKPVIAKVHGPALGGGCGMVACCDIAIASDKAKFATTEINVGMFPMVIAPILTHTIGRKKTMELGLTGAIIDAQEAMRIGLINRVVPEDQLDAAVMELANQIKARSNVPIRIGKTALNVMEDMDFDKALEYARHTNTIWFTSTDVKEGTDAFLEKRKPVWKDC